MGEVVGRRRPPSPPGIAVTGASCPGHQIPPEGVGSSLRSKVRRLCRLFKWDACRLYCNAPSPTSYAFVFLPTGRGACIVRSSCSGTWPELALSRQKVEAMRTATRYCCGGLSPWGDHHSQTPRRGLLRLRVTSASQEAGFRSYNSPTNPYECAEADGDTHTQNLFPEDS